MIDYTIYKLITMKEGIKMGENKISKVYFTDFRARPGYNLLQKLEKLVKKQG